MLVVEQVALVVQVPTVVVVSPALLVPVALVMVVVVSVLVALVVPVVVVGVVSCVVLVFASMLQVAPTPAAITTPPLLEVLVVQVVAQAPHLAQERLVLLGMPLVTTSLETPM